MIENFIFSANAVFPIFLVIAFGAFLRYKNFLSTNAIGEMNRLVFSFALPLLLFRNIYRADFSTLLDLRFILWVITSIIILFVLLWAVAEICFRKQKDLIGAFVQASFRSNYAIVGLPLVANMLGDRDTGLAALASAFIVTSYNVLSVIVLTAKDAKSEAISLKLAKDIVVGICKNPSIIGIVLGVTINLLNLPLPIIVHEGVNYMAILCTPMALIAVGGSVKAADVMKHLKPAVFGTAIKIAITPLIFMPISIWMGFRGEALAVLFVMFANPTAIISYAMADRMNGNTAITSTIILMTTVFSSITLTIGVYLLLVLGLV